MCGRLLGWSLEEPNAAQGKQQGAAGEGEFEGGAEVDKLTAGGFFARYGR